MRFLLLISALLLLLFNVAQSDGSSPQSSDQKNEALVDSPVRSGPYPYPFPTAKLSQNISARSEPPQNESTQSNLPNLSVSTQSGLSTETPTERPPERNPLAGQFPTSAAVRAAQKVLQEQQIAIARAKDEFRELRKRLTKVTTTLGLVTKVKGDLEREKLVKNRMMEAGVQLLSLRRQVKRCHGLGAKFTSQEVMQMASVEARRLMQNDREQLIMLSQRNKYYKLLREFRQNIRTQIHQVSALLSDRTTTKRVSLFI